MIDLGLYNFIKNALARGQTEEQIRETLAKAGWAEVLINEGVEAAKKGDAPNLPHPHVGVAEHTEELEGSASAHSGGSWSERWFPMFHGRIGVGGYWKAVLVGLFFSLALWLVNAALWLVIAPMFIKMSAAHMISQYWTAIVLSTYVSLFVYGIALFFMLGVTVRRLHDLGFSGLVFLFPLLGYGVSYITGSIVPYVVCEMAPLAFMLLVWFWPGSAQLNRYGPFTYYTWGQAFFGEGSMKRSLLVAVAASLLFTIFVSVAYAALIFLAIAGASSFM